MLDVACWKLKGKSLLGVAYPRRASWARKRPVPSALGKSNLFWTCSSCTPAKNSRKTAETHRNTKSSLDFRPKNCQQALQTYQNSSYSYNQPSYYRTNPNTSSVEYVPGYTVPRQRWIQKYNGELLDMIPQTPDQSIFFHQSEELRRRNEMDFYGYTFSMDSMGL